MSHSQLRKFLFTPLVLFALALIAIACSSDSGADSEANSVSNADTGDYETCEGFLSADDLENEVGTTGLIDRARVLDIASVPGLAESGATANCLVEIFRTVDGSDSPSPGDSVSLSLVQFENNELAASLYNSTLAAAILTVEQVGDLAEIHQSVVGADSYLMDVKLGGIGAIVVYVFDSTFISISSTADNEGNALLDGQKLVNVAQGVQSRLH